MKTKPLAALLGPLVAFVAMAALGAYSSLGHLKTLSSNDKALLFVGLGVLGALAVVLGTASSARAARSQRPAKGAAGELASQVEELLSGAVPAALQAALDNPGATPPALPVLDDCGSEDLARLATSFQRLAAAAVELAADQAGQRQMSSEAFLNLGRRNQNLVTRQLEYISELELGEADPETLDKLFRLDHLATRMRRNAESLLILAGSGPAGHWDAPVPAMDIARAASALVEDYKRLRLHHFDPAVVSGPVTTDLVHILAELLENSLTFSPPASPVDVYGRYLEGGYVIVIADVGIGMSDDDLATANRRLSGESTERELPGRYLGHFVAGRLAARHGISVSLQPSQSGGLVARIKVPSSLVQDTPAETADRPPAQISPSEVRGYGETGGYDEVAGHGNVPAGEGDQADEGPAWGPVGQPQRTDVQAAVAASRPSAPDLGNLSPLAGHAPRHLAGPDFAAPPVAHQELGPAAQARSTADALRRLTRRVPGASLSEDDGALKRSTPEDGLDAAGITTALSQYLAATATATATATTTAKAPPLTESSSWETGWDPTAQLERALGGTGDRAADEDHTGSAAYNPTEDD
jgi:signal transduction histidine kinase